MKKVLEVKALKNYILQLKFDTEEIRYFDVKPYLNLGIFTELQNESYFNQVSKQFDSIAWKNGQDFSPETLYIKSVKNLI